MTADTFSNTDPQCAKQIEDFVYPPPPHMCHQGKPCSVDLNSPQTRMDYVKIDCCFTFLINLKAFFFLQ